MLPPEFITALKIVASRLYEQAIPWAVIGSANMALQTIPIKPHDLDIVVGLSSLRLLPRLFKEYSPSEVVELKNTAGIAAWHITFKVQGVDVEIIAEEETGFYALPLSQQRTIKIQLDTTIIPCLMLESEIIAYQNTNRHQKADLILAHLHKKK